MAWFTIAECRALRYWALNELETTNPFIEKEEIQNPSIVSVNTALSVKKQNSEIESNPKRKSKLKRKVTKKSATQKANGIEKPSGINDDSRKKQKGKKRATIRTARSRNIKTLKRRVVPKKKVDQKKRTTIRTARNRNIKTLKRRVVSKKKNDQNCRSYNYPKVQAFMVDRLRRLIRLLRLINYHDCCLLTSKRVRTVAHRLTELRDRGE